MGTFREQKFTFSHGRCAPGTLPEAGRRAPSHSQVVAVERSYDEIGTDLDWEQLLCCIEEVWLLQPTEQWFCQIKRRVALSEVRDVIVIDLESAKKR